jgi:anti-anti-sigma regulatory factor
MGIMANVEGIERREQDDSSTRKRIERLAEVLEFLSASIFVESMVTIEPVHRDELGTLEERMSAFAREYIRTTVESDQRHLTIVEQKEAIAKLSSPILEIWDGVILVPVIGKLDEARAAELTPPFLGAIQRSSADVAILDLTGVNASGVEVTESLQRIIQAAGLMGCRCILSGLRPAFAGSLAQNGADIGNTRVAGRLKDALRIAIQMEIAGPSRTKNGSQT